MTGLGDPQVAEQVMAYIAAARWFAGKGRLVELVSLTPLPWLSEVTEFYAPSGPRPCGWRSPRWRTRSRRTRDRTARTRLGRRSATASRELYQLAVSYRRRRTPTCTTPRSPGSSDPDLGPVVAYDAARDPEACRVLLQALIGRGPAVATGTPRSGSGRTEPPA